MNRTHNSLQHWHYWLRLCRHCFHKEKKMCGDDTHRGRDLSLTCILTLLVHLQKDILEMFSLILVLFLSVKHNFSHS